MMSERLHETFSVRWSRVDRWLIFITSVIVLVGMYLLSQRNYLLFHALTEFFSIVIACGIFMFAWNTRRNAENGYLQFIGVAYLGVALIDLLHTLAYKGMGVFPGFAGSNLATQLWIAARYVESLSLLLAVVFIRRKGDARLFFVGYTAVIAAVVLVIFKWRMFPDCYREGFGLTPFKVAGEYVICCLLLAAAVLIYRRREYLTQNVLIYLLASIAITIISEMSFTLYNDVYGVMNMVGHLLKIASFYLIYMATIQTGLVRPFSWLFQSLRRNQKELEAARSELEDRVRERTAELQESEKRYRVLTETSPNAIILADVNDRILVANQEAAMLAGFMSPDELIGKNIWEFQAPGQARIKDGSILKALQKQNLLALEFTIMRQDRTTVPVEVNLSGIKSADGTLDSYVLVAQNITERKNQQEKEKEYQHHLRSLAMELSVSEERERRRVAVGLHDGIGQSLALLRMKIGAHKTSSAQEKCVQSMEEIDGLVADIIKNTRSMIFELSPPILYELGLVPALNWLAEKTTAEHALQVSVKNGERHRPIPEDIRVFLFQATRELLHNVIKHAQAERVEIRLEHNEQEFNLRVFDDGIGYRKGSLSAIEGFGLFHIRERLRHLGGQLTLATAQGSGCSVTLSLPWTGIEEFSQETQG